MMGQHTMCTYPTESPGSECVSLTGQGIDSKQIEELLTVHNKYRDYVAAGRETRTFGGSMPHAANMGVLTWDEEIARIAQRWALQCHFGHDECRDLPNMKVGQNVAITGSSVQGPPNVTSIALMWYDKEVVSFNAAGVGSYTFSSATGHFSQWIWATSYKLGCGYAGYQNGMMNSHFLVCNYGPAGNVMRLPVYQQGSPCSACPQGTTCGGDSRYPNLCKADGDGVPAGGGGGGGLGGFGQEGQFGSSFNSGSVEGRSVLLGALSGTLALRVYLQQMP